jgi:stage V sporulation protein B
MKKLRKFILSALMLCGVSFLMRTVNVSFNVYVSNRAGAETMGLYALLSGVYGFALTFATSGINLATMRLVAEALGVGASRQKRKALKCCLIYSLTFGTAATALLFLLAKPIAVRLLDDIRTLSPIRILAFSLLPISLTSVFAGYFTAVRRVYKNAAVQVAEQAIRIFSISQLLTLLLPRGMEAACIALAAGGVFADFCSFFMSFVAFLLDNRKTKTEKSVSNDTNSQRLPKKLLSIALPVALSACARSGLISLEHVLIPIGLRKSGSSREHALAAYGTLQSMALPIILFPSALIGSFAGLLVPEITECRVKNNTRQIRYISERMLQLSLLFSIGVAGIMIFFSREIGDVIYPGKNTDQYIWLLAPLIPIMYVDSGVDAILKGMGKQLYSMIVNIVDAALSVILVWALLPKYGIYGFIVTIYVTETVNTVLSVSKLISISHIKPRLCKWILGPLFCIVGATCTAKLMLPSSALYTPSALTLTLHMVLVSALYFLFLTLCHVLDKEDIDWAVKILKKEPQNQ